MAVRGVAPDRRRTVRVERALWCAHSRWGADAGVPDRVPRWAV